MPDAGPILDRQTIEVILRNLPHVGLLPRADVDLGYRRKVDEEGGANIHPNSLPVRIPPVQRDSGRLLSGTLLAL
jgi:hypothetical protein